MEKTHAWERAGEGSWSRLQEVEGRLVDGGPSQEKEEKRRRPRDFEDDDASGVARGLIRHVVVVIDASRAALLTDMRPTRLGATIGACAEFVEAFFGTNPVSSIAVIKAADGTASRLSRMSGAKRPHIEAIQSLGKKPHFPPSGPFSLQAVLDEARVVLAKTPDYGRREILLVVSSLATRDGEDIFQRTLKRLQKFQVTVNVVSLAAETHIFKTLALQTDGTFTVSLDRAHFSRLLDAHVPPPKVTKKPNTQDKRLRPTLIEMGFPTLRVDAACPKICAVSADASKPNAPQSTLQLEWNIKTFACPRCATRVAALPCNCPVCDLPLVQASHLATSYHHLFPVPRFHEINLLAKDDKKNERYRRASCFGCFDPLVPPNRTDDADDDPKKKQPDPLFPTDSIETALDSGGLFAYVCPRCKTAFCASCDEYIHASLHNCPACDERSSFKKKQSSRPFDDDDDVV